MEKFVIQGGAPLSGEIVAAGNKNAALPSIAACLLTEEEVVLSNVPRIRDTEAQIALLDRLGVKVEWSAENEIRLQADAVTDTAVDEGLSARIRASFLLAGPPGRRRSPTRPASRTSRTWPACWSGWARRSTASART